MTAKTRPTVKSLPCELTAEEYTQRAERLVAVMAEIEETKAELQAAKKAYAEKLERLEGTRVELGNVLHARLEYRDVKCVLEVDAAAGVERLVRLDTGEPVRERKLTEAELQEDLLPEEDVPPLAGAAGEE